jgi:hypothetical protein
VIAAAATTTACAFRQEFTFRRFVYFATKNMGHQNYGDRNIE